jgi:hypothetical protein
MQNNKKIWLVIEKSNYGGTTNSYRIEKTADTIEQAITFKVHLDALNDSKNKSYFLASDIDTVMDRVITSHNKKVEEKPLVLKNGVDEEIPF